MFRRAKEYILLMPGWQRDEMLSPPDPPIEKITKPLFPRKDEKSDVSSEEDYLARAA